MDSHTISVDLGERSYPIVIGADLIANRFDLTPHLAGKRCLVVSSKTVAPLYLEALKSCLEDADIRTVTLPDGENHKTVATATSILDELVACKANRDTTVIALGGGVVGDIAGFAAACFMRGVAFIQVPTTLLSQVDSSVGGKTGVNHPGGKNLIGAFHQPRIVLIDTHTLKTLPDRELRSGLAEVIKYGAIVDKEFFAWLETNMASLLERDPATLAYAIRRSCEIKAEVVAADERETGKRALLNFGHTFAHAIEHCIGYGEWLHGEAVAAGMVMAAAMSNIDQAEQDRIKALITAAGLPSAPPKTGAAQLHEAMQMDKKAKAGKLRFVLLHSLGDAYISTDYTFASLDAALSASES